MHIATVQSEVEVARTLRRARSESGLSLRELARRAGTSHTTLLAYERGSKTPGAGTFLRILNACDLAVDLKLSPRIRQADGLERGKELEQVLDLAAQFPARHSPELELPVFGYRQ